MDLVCYTDGGYNNVSKTNGYGSFRIYDPALDVIIRLKFDTINSSNEAEYQTMIELLKYLLEFYPLESNVSIYSDSKMMVNQLNKLWQVRAENLMPLYLMADTLMEKFNNITLTWVGRSNLVRELGH